MSASPDVGRSRRVQRVDKTARSSRRHKPRLPDLVANLTLILVEGGPHNIGWTHPDECNKAMLDFLADDGPNLDSAVGTASGRA